MLRSIIPSVLILASAATKSVSGYVWENFQSSQVGLVQWLSHAGTVNNMRSYHVDTENNIRESRWSTGTVGWSSSPIGIKAHGDIVAGVHTYSDDPNDVMIRLFFQSKDAARTDPDSGESLYRMMSVFNDRGTGWKVDDGFAANVGYIGKPRSVISWQHLQGPIQWRFYYLSVTVKAGWSWQLVAQALGTPGKAASSDQLDIATMYRSNTIYEAALVEGPPGSTARWTLGNGGKGLDTVITDPWGHIGLTALTWGNGTRISLLYWQNGDHTGINPGRIREKRWKDGEGWVLQDLPNGDWKGFQNTFGAISAVTWTDLRDVDQIRLYVKWVSVNSGKNRLVEFTANENGWTGQSKDFADHAAAGGPMAAVAWRLNNKVHIRIHSPKCKYFEGSAEKRCMSVFVGETAFDSGTGWYDSGAVDDKNWAAFRA